MKRVVEPELLDSDAGTPQEVAGALASLRWVNRWFGGVSTTQTLIERVAERLGRTSLSILDVACASGDTSLLASHAIHHRGISLDLTLLDRAASHLPRNGARRIVGDAMRLPFRDNSFDAIGCSLFLHHLEPESAAAFVNEALRVARVAVLINDLRRSPMHLALVYAGWPLFRSRMAWIDGVISVRRAFTMEETAAILRRTQAATVEIEPTYLYRFAAIAWKQGTGASAP